MMTSPGHKRSQHLVEAEAYRRIMSGKAPETLVEFAQQLFDWLKQIYSEASPTPVRRDLCGQRRQATLAAAAARPPEVGVNT